MKHKFCICCVCLLLILTKVCTEQAPEKAIVFSKAKGEAFPNGWKRYSKRSLRTFGTGKRLIRLTSRNSEFQFHLESEKFSYVIRTAYRGSYLIRLGFAERRRCERQKRVLSFTVNGIKIPPFDVADEVGCNTPFYRDVLVDVRKNKKVVILAERLSVSGPPILSNVAIFRTLQVSQSSMLSSALHSETSWPSKIAGPSSSYTSGRSEQPSILTSVMPALPQSADPSVSVTTSSSCSADQSPSASASLSISTNPSALATASSSPSQKITIELSEVEVNVGVDVWPLSDKSIFERITRPDQIDVTGVDFAISAEVFDTAVQGQLFNLSFPLSAGTYDITLGFAEYDVSKCTETSRTFSVHVNGIIFLESVNIFDLANGCRRAVTVILPGLAIEEFNKEPLVLVFQGISAPALLSYVSIQRANVQCIPVSGDINMRDDHLAHAVSGKYPPNGDSSYVDQKNTGFVKVFIDGRQSHTHFFSNGRAGHIRTYTWTNLETADVLSRASNFWYDFPRGTTRVRLSILDEACSTDTADFSVTVTGNKQTGAYCYYYKDLDAVPPSGMLGTEQHWPIQAYVQKSLTFNFPTFWFSRMRFSSRCIFSMEVEQVSKEFSIFLVTRESGHAQLYRSKGLVYDSKATTERESRILLAVGIHEFELLYYREDLSQDGFLQVLFDNFVPQSVFFDQLSVVPLVTKVSPDGGRVKGDETVTIVGFGLYLPLTVKFGITAAKILELGASSTRVQAITPKVEDEKSVSVSVVSASGLRSNSVSYIYGVDCDEISFERHELMTDNEEKLNIGSATCVTTWLDGSLFIGTYDGHVRVLHYNLNTLRVSSVCQSERMINERFKDAGGEASVRTILGIAFDPRDVTTPRPYISTSTLFWDRRNGIANVPSYEKWANGAVERLKPVSEHFLRNDGSTCLAFDKRIVSNLPVSDGDHSVNAILFTQTGDLLIAVGGFTNAGLPYMSAGGNWETILSGAIIRARLSLGEKYDGEIVYEPKNNLRTAKLVKGDVEIYATGFRNLFSLTMTRSGAIYGVDMGPNCQMGNASSGCDEYDETEASVRDTSLRQPFPGRVNASVDDNCVSGVARDDKLLRVVQGAYYGHPNLQRAKLENVSECAWIDPLTNMVPFPFLGQAPAHYVRPVAIVKSAMTALFPYGGKAFCGRLRHSLLLGLYKGFGVFRAQAADAGSEKDGEGGWSVERVANGGGVGGVENAVGDILFVSNVEGSISVLRPVVSRMAGMTAVNALPVRHPRLGGSQLTVGGWGFSENVTVLVGDRDCKVSRVTDSTVVCEVPPFVGYPGQEAVDVRVIAPGIGAQIESTSVLTKAVLYMQV